MQIYIYSNVIYDFNVKNLFDILNFLLSLNKHFRNKKCKMFFFVIKFSLFKTPSKKKSSNIFSKYKY